MSTRLRWEAALYDPAPPRKPGQKGRPRKKGARRPTVQHVLTARQTRGTPITVNAWYGGGAREVEVGTDTAGWYHSAVPPVTVRGVLIRDPRDLVDPPALGTTCLTPTPAQRREWFVRRGRMEGTCEAARAHLGIATQRHWNDWVLARTPPALVGLSSLVALMAHGVVQAEEPFLRTSAWYGKERPPFSDALAVVASYGALAILPGRLSLRKW